MQLVPAPRGRAVRARRAAGRDGRPRRPARIRGRSDRNADRFPSEYAPLSRHRGVHGCGSKIEFWRAVRTRRALGFWWIYRLQLVTLFEASPALSSAHSYAEKAVRAVTATRHVGSIVLVALTSAFFFRQRQTCLALRLVYRARSILGAGGAAALGILPISRRAPPERVKL